MRQVGLPSSGERIASLPAASRALGTWCKRRCGSPTARESRNPASGSSSPRVSRSARPAPPMSSGSPGSIADGGGTDYMDLSVVIPVKNEAENIPPLVREIRAALDGFIGYEIVFIDDGSNDATAAEIRQLPSSTPPSWPVRPHPHCVPTPPLSPPRQPA